MLICPKLHYSEDKPSISSLAYFELFLTSEEQLISFEVTEIDFFCVFLGVSLASELLKLEVLLVGVNEDFLAVFKGGFEYLSFEATF